MTRSYTVSRRAAISDHEYFSSARARAAAPIAARRGSSARSRRHRRQAPQGRRVGTAHGGLGSHHVAVAVDVGGEHRQRAAERPGQHHAEALAAERRCDQRLRRGEQRGELVLGEEPDDLDPLGCVRSRASSIPTASGSAPAILRVAPVRRWISGHARRSTCSPLRGSCRPAKTTEWSRRDGSTAGGMRTPFGITSQGPPSHRSAESRARSETATRWSIRSIRNPQAGIPSFIHPRSPEA